MKRIYSIVFSLLLLVGCSSTQEKSSSASNSKMDIKVATYNSSLYRKAKGELFKSLNNGWDIQALNLAKVIQEVRPDVLILQEFDYEEGGESLDVFVDKYLNKDQGDTEAINYKYRWSVPTNTGYATGVDLDGDGKLGAGDCFGFGQYEGQYGFAILSKFPFDQSQAKTFQKFLWKDMPNANLPVKEDGQSYYSDEALEIFRLSSKNHIDLTVDVNGTSVHLLVAHPTPPVFDGEEDRNGKRNHDEIRLLADYISGGEKAVYLYDDKGEKGGLKPNSHFIVFGDMNADPIDGDSFNSAIHQLTKHSEINNEASEGKFVPQRTEVDSISYALAKKYKKKGDVKFQTSEFGLRIDYVLPSNNFEVKGSGIFWPSASDSLGYLMERDASSDHRMVWMELGL
ncbi:endonuclease/exonuclease/phosphatase family protein [Sediminitomix flava]|uniref:Endonuclease/exonuclease/phosphatase family protein n=1 Tax=Sediminitomix flava TaxID=379075 RepID=A0A315ZBH4_SEDFL|nr:endonuclease/exonuclease/phosphatase family protein [Sediminitomix flava]PWJ42148.1 endonuclease/exonuclease/phosphatase family protein [Sediminitomix flava]